MACCIADDVDVVVVERGFAQLWVVGQQGVEGAAVGVQQAGAGDVGTLCCGDEMDFGGDEGVCTLPGFDTQGIEVAPISWTP